MLLKTSLREIRTSLGRYLAIFSIIALGVGFFAGLRVTRAAMLNTADEYLSELHMFDGRLLSTLGWTQEDVDAFAGLAGVRAAAGVYSADFLRAGESGSDTVLKAYSLTSGINDLCLQAGRLPEKADECVVDAWSFEESDIGKTVRLSENNSADTIDAFAYREYTIVGVANSPIYINYERGGTSLGNGTVSAFVYLPEDGFTLDYFTEIDVTFTDSGRIYSDEYKAAADAMEEPLQTLADERAQLRYESLRADAQSEIDDAQQKLNDAQSELESGWSDYRSAERQYQDGLAKYESGMSQYEDGQAQYESGLARYEEALAQYEQLSASPAAGAMGPQLTQMKAQLDATAAQLEASRQTLESTRAQLEASKRTLDSTPAQLAEAKDKLTSGEQELAENRAKLDDAKAQLDELKTPDTYVLGRGTNVGYACFESDTNIVAGISRVFPLFFFLLAALVCITTMTRMVEDQRTQLGTLMRSASETGPSSSSTSSIPGARRSSAASSGLSAGRTSSRRSCGCRITSCTASRWGFTSCSTGALRRYALRVICSARWARRISSAAAFCVRCRRSSSARRRQRPASASCSRRSRSCGSGWAFSRRSPCATFCAISSGFS